MEARTRAGRLLERRADPGRPLDLHAVVSGIIAAFALTVLASAVLGAVIYFTDVHEGHVAGFLYYAGLLVVGAGGAIAGRRASGRGWLHGGLAGVGYVLVSLLVGSLILPGTELLAGIAGKLGTAFVAGALGGVVGVNL